MLYNRFLYLAIVILSTLTSCYHRELVYSFDTSHGGVTYGGSYYYLAQAREYQLPKGISRFPDGGVPRDIRIMFGLYKTDTISKSTTLVSQLSNPTGWPSRYSTRLDKNSECIAIGIVNATLTDSLCGIYLYDFKSGKLNRYSKVSGLPALCSTGNQMAYCVMNKLVVDDYPSKTTLYSYLLNTAPVFVTWKSNNEICIYFFNPKVVKILNTSTGKNPSSDLKYRPNYDQEIDISQINKLLKGNPDLAKEMLDKYH